MRSELVSGNSAHNNNNSNLNPTNNCNINHSNNGGRKSAQRKSAVTDLTQAIGEECQKVLFEK
jgi:hypothetical protein